MADGSPDGDADGTGTRGNHEPGGDPFGELESAVGDREGDPFEGESLFDEREPGRVDPETVWDDLATAGASDPVDGERTSAEVSKHSYCERCEYFSDPPEIECHHEGTEILAFLDVETVRVVDCPVVAERRELGQE